MRASSRFNASAVARSRLPVLLNHSDEGRKSGTIRQTGWSDVSTASASRLRGKSSPDGIHDFLCHERLVARLLRDRRIVR